MQRIIDGLAGQPVGLHGIGHRGGLHRQADVVKVKFFEQARVIERALDQRLGRRPAEALQNVLLDRTGVDADADRDARRARRLDDLVHPVVRADVARIEPDLLHTGGNGSQRQLIVKMDVGHDRQGRIRADFLERVRRFQIGHGAADDVAARVSQRADLGERRLRIAGVGVRHGLHRNGCAAADRHRADHDLSCFHRCYHLDDSNIVKRTAA